MLKNACLLCKIVGAIAIIGALNWGILGLTNVNVVDMVLGTTASRVVYVIVGLSGLALLASYFTTCPKCKKD